MTVSVYWKLCGNLAGYVVAVSVYWKLYGNLGGGSISILELSVVKQ